MNILFLDTETSSFRAQRPGDKFGPMCQLAAKLRADGRETIMRDLVQPCGWEIRTDAQAVHGITQERCEREGKPLVDVLTRFGNMAYRADVMVSYGLAFDAAVLTAEYMSLGMACPTFAFLRCVMEAATGMCRIPARRRGYKHPTLTEAARILLGVEHEHAHDALADLLMLERVHDRIYHDEEKCVG